MAVTLSSAENALRSAYLGVLANQLNNGVNPFYAQIKQSSDGVFGKEIIKLAPVGINGGIGAGTEDGTLPEAYGNKYLTFKTTLKNLYGKIEISDKAILASQSNSGAFINLLNAEMEGLLDASKFNLGRMLFGNGTGKIGEVDIIAPLANTVRLSTGISNVMVGMHIQIIKGDGTILYDGHIIEIDKTTTDLTLTGPGSVTTLIEGESVYIASSKNNELTGLGAIFDVSKELYGNVRTGAGAAKCLIPTTDMVQASASSVIDRIQTCTDMIEEYSGEKTNYITTTYAVRRALINHLSKNVSNIDVTNLKGGYTSITVAGKPVVADRFCPSKHVYMLNTDNFTIHQLCDWRFIESENGSVLHQVPNKPVYTATLVKYAELICNKPSGMARLTNALEN